ncbi:MAG: response regulator [Candidatus Pacebacteria bacterium]|nr:response regulator [Candidatus Paceibacterota bacterium]
MVTIRLFLSAVASYFHTYPRITNPIDLCAYYRKFNKSLPMGYAGFMIGVIITQIVRLLTSVMDGVPKHILFDIIRGCLIMDSITCGIGCYTLWLKKKGDLPENKCSLDFQRRMRSRAQLVCLIPNVAFIFVSLTVLHGMSNSGDFVNYLWFITLGFDLQVITWMIDGLAYKTFLFALANIGYCMVARFKGYFLSCYYARMFTPIVIALFIFVANDRYVKENFILRRMLKQQRNMYEKFLEKLQDPLIIITKRRMEFENAAAKAKLGVTKENFHARALLMITGNGVALSDYVKSRLARNVPLSNEVIQERYYVHNEDSDVIATTSIVMVTVIESNAFSYRKALFIAIHDVTDEQIQSEKRVEAKYKNMLLFSLSHELRTPLNIFQALLKVSKEFLRGDEAKEILTDAKGAWRYLRNKISDILDYAQILNDSFRLHRATFSLSQFVEQLRKITLRLLGKKRNTIRLEFSVQSTLRDSFTGDRDRLEQVLFNFLTNAVKYTDNGTIALSVFSPPTDKQLLTFSIRDTGCGMSTESIASLFELKDENSPKLVAEGNGSKKATCLSGLGLTATRMICSRMGSEIHASSQPGQGSVFSFSIFVNNDGDTSAVSESAVPEDDLIVNRCKKGHYPGMEACGGRAPSTMPSKILMQKEFVLVVDDNVFNRNVARAMVNKFGYRTVEAENGQVALKRLHDISENNSVIILMDLNMPVMDGIEATVEIRKEKGRPQPFIAALTAFASEKERAKCMDAGMNLFISKPLTKEALKDLFTQFKLSMTRTKAG